MKLMFTVLSLTAFMAVSIDAWCFDYWNYYCYQWTDEDLDAIGPNPSAETAKHQCESYIGNAFTGGNNTYYPYCGDCWCCKPDVYMCYNWQAEEETALGSSPTVLQDKLQCESHENFVFQGRNATYPHCRDCPCCQPVYECYSWTPDDIRSMGPDRTTEDEVERCEHLEFIYTHGNNERFPGTSGGCRCIKPKLELQEFFP